MVMRFMVLMLILMSGVYANQRNQIPTTITIAM